jgi:Arm DNA-binding domain
MKMPRRAKGLTATFVRKAEPGRYANGANLYLFVRGPQVKFWSFRYVRNGRMREMGLSPATGPVAVSLAEARARANLSAMYAWAIGEALCDVNPVIGTNDPADDLKARDRGLNDAELRLVWDAAGDGDFGRIVRLLILPAPGGKRSVACGGKTSISTPAC